MRLRADLHTHTSHSPDGLSSPEALVRAAAAAGIDVLGVTDHNTLSGGLAARAAAERIPTARRLLVIPGIELRTREGDVLVYGVPHDLPVGLPLARVIAAVRAHRGALIIPHPFDPWRRGLLARSGTPVAPFVAFEAFNARCYRRAFNRAALASRSPLGRIACSDSHHARELGRCYTVLQASRTPASVFASLKAGRAELVCAPLPRLQHLRGTFAKLLRF